MLDWAVNRFVGALLPADRGPGGSRRPQDPGLGGLSPVLFHGEAEKLPVLPGQDRDLWQAQDPGAGHNLLWELLLAAPEGSGAGLRP